MNASYNFFFFMLVIIFFFHASYSYNYNIISIIYSINLLLKNLLFCFLQN